MSALQRDSDTLRKHRNILIRMLFKVTAYYVVLGAAVAIAVAVIPGFASQLPLGGVGEIADFGSSSIYDLEEALLSADDEEIEDIVTENTPRAPRPRPGMAARGHFTDLRDVGHPAPDAAGVLGLQGDSCRQCL